MVVGTGVAAVVVTPVLLAGARFMNPGVAAGFITAMRHVHVCYGLDLFSYYYRTLTF